MYLIESMETLFLYAVFSVLLKKIVHRKNVSTTSLVSVKRMIHIQSHNLDYQEILIRILYLKEQISMLVQSFYLKRLK